MPSLLHVWKLAMSCCENTEWTQQLIGPESTTFSLGLVLIGISSAKRSSSEASLSYGCTGILLGRHPDKVIYTFMHFWCR